MPVTATLSRKFYEKLGDDITNELVNWFNQVDTTYRTELKELQLRVHFGAKPLELGVQLSDALVQLRVKPREVRLVELFQLSAISRVHLVEPVHELIRDVVAQLLVELPGQRCCHRHRVPPLESGDSLTIRSARVAINLLQGRPFRCVTADSASSSTSRGPGRRNHRPGST